MEVRKWDQIVHKLIVIEKDKVYYTSFAWNLCNKMFKNMSRSWLLFLVRKSLQIWLPKYLMTWIIIYWHSLFGSQCLRIRPIDCVTLKKTWIHWEFLFHFITFYLQSCFSNSDCYIVYPFSVIMGWLLLHSRVLCIIPFLQYVPALILGSASLSFDSLI